MVERRSGGIHVEVRLDELPFLTKADADGEPEKVLLKKERLSILHSALSALPEEEKTVIVSTVINRNSLHAISEKMRKDAEEIKNLKESALHLLRENEELKRVLYGERREKKEERRNAPDPIRHVLEKSHESDDLFLSSFLQECAMVAGEAADAVQKKEEKKESVESILEGKKEVKEKRHYRRRTAQYINLCTVVEISAEDANDALASCEIVLKPARKRRNTFAERLAKAQQEN